MKPGLSAELHVAGRYGGPSRMWSVRQVGAGPVTAEVGTERERVRVTVMPSGAYTVEVVDGEGNAMRRLSIDARVRGQLTRIRRRHIRGKLRS